MKSLIFRSMAVSFSLVALSACTKKQELSKVVVQLPSVAANQSKIKNDSQAKNLSAMNASPSWGLPRPQTLAEAKCFAVVVETPDASSNAKKCNATDPTKSLYASHFAGLAEAGATIEMNIPSGIDRKFHLLAFNADSAAECKTMQPGSLIASSRLSAPAHLGTKKVDIIAGDNPPIELIGSFSGAVPIENCEWTAPASLTGGSIVINAGQPFTNVVGVSVTPALSYLASDAYYTQDSTCATGGTWEPYTATKTGIVLSTGDGVKTVYAKFRDSTGSTSSCLSASVTLDQTIPTLNAGTPPTINTTNVTSYGFGGSCSENGQVVSWQVGSMSGTATCTSGSYSVSAVNFAALAQGLQPVSISTTDLAGNVGLITFNILKDTVIPSVVITTPPNGLYISTLNQTALYVAGTCSDNGQSIQLNGGITPVMTTCAAGVFSASMSFTSIADGPVMVTATHLDLAGNSGASIINLVKDTVAPVATLSGVPSGIVLTPNSTLTVSGVGVASYRTFVTFGGPGDCTVASNYSAAIPVATALALGTPSPGAYYICVLGVDAAGNQQNGAISTQASITKGPIVVTFAQHMSLDAESTPIRNIAINITPNAGLPIPIEVQVQGSAMQGVHYMGFNTAVESITIPANTSSMSFPVSIIGSTIATHEKVMSLALRSSPTVGGVSLGISEHQLWIEDAQATPAVMTKTSIGGSHSCALNQNGKLFCWGYGGSGNLAQGNTLDQLEPMPVDPANLYVDVSAGINSTCAVRSTGDLMCWGQNSSGQVGDATLVQRLLPVQVGTNFTTVSVGNSFACATKATGDVYCWGDQSNGRLGNGTTAAGTVNVPANVPGIAGATKVTTGWDHACARASAGALYCWGANTYGQVGNGTATDQAVPAMITLPSSAADVSAGLYYTCAINGGANAFCWGQNSSGKLGTGNQTNLVNPTAVMVGTFFSSIRAGNNTTCGIENATQMLKCWGAAFNGILGDGVPKQLSYTGVTPALPGGAATTQVAMGINTSSVCAISGGRPYCWGSNPYGILGNGLMNAQPTTIMKPNLPFAKLSLGRGGCLIRQTGQLMCWGPNHLTDIPKSMVGDGSLTSRYAPVYIDAPNLYVEVSVGYSHSCAITNAAELKCWGSNTYGQLGDGTTNDSPLPVLVGTGYGRVSVGEDSTCAITTSGILKCWGSNVYGQLGDATNLQKLTPTTIMAGTAFTSVDVGNQTTCGLTNVAALYCWGRNHFGQLANGTTVDSNTPVARSGTYLAFSAGAYVTCGIRTGGLLYCAGRNASGEIGQGIATPVNHSIDTQITGTWSSISVGTNVRTNAPGAHVCGLTSGVIKCWGATGLGQNAPALSTLSPTVMPGSYSEVWTGEAQTCGLTTTSELTCRGLSQEAQLPFGVSYTRPNLLPRVRF